MTRAILVICLWSLCGLVGLYTAHLKAAMYGVINAVVCAPVMIGFAAIIFRHPAFHADPAVYPALVKLVLFSSAVHQTAFTTFSSLPFAIGQVQDAGLIFLSQIAGDIAEEMIDAPPEHMLATVLSAHDTSDRTPTGVSEPSPKRRTLTSADFGQRSPFGDAAS